MFTQKKLLFQFTKVIALVILFCFTFSYQAQGEKAVKEKAKDVAEITAQPKYDYETGFEDGVDLRLGKLVQEFNKPHPKFDDMADQLGDNTILTTPQGVRLKGKDSLSNFWRKEKGRGVIRVEFIKKHLRAIKVADPIEQGEDTIEHVGHAIIDYHLITIQGEGTLTNKTGTFTMSLRHPRSCEWDD